VVAVVWAVLVVADFAGISELIVCGTKLKICIVTSRHLGAALINAAEAQTL